MVARLLRLLGLRRIADTTWIDRVGTMTVTEVLIERLRYLEEEVVSLELTRDKALKTADKADTHAQRLLQEIDELKEAIRGNP